MAKKIGLFVICLLVLFIVMNIVETNSYRRESFGDTISVTPQTDPALCLDLEIIKDNWKPVVERWNQISPSTPFDSINQIVNAVRSYDMIAVTKTKPYLVYVLDQADDEYSNATENGVVDANWAIYTTYNKCAFDAGTYNTPSLVFAEGEPLTFNSFNLPFYQYKASWLVDNLIEMEATGPNTLEYWIGLIANDPTIDVLCYRDSDSSVFVGSTLEPDTFLEAGQESDYNTYVRTQTGAYSPPSLPTGPAGKWMLYQNKVAIPYYMRKEILAMDIFKRKVATYNEWLRWAIVNEYDMVNYPTNYLGQPVNNSSVIWVGKLEDINATYSSVDGYKSSLEPAVNTVGASSFFGPFNGGVVRVNELGELECIKNPSSSGCLATIPALNPVNLVKLASTIKDKGDAGDPTIPFEPNQFLQNIQTQPSIALQQINTPTDVSNVSINPDGSISIPQPDYKPSSDQGGFVGVADQSTVTGKLSDVIATLGKKKNVGVFDRQGVPVDINRIEVSMTNLETVACDKQCVDSTASSGRTVTSCKYKDPVCSSSLPWMKYLLQNNQFAAKMGLFIFMRDLSVWSFVPIVSQSNPSKCIGQSSNGPLSAQLLNCDPSLMWSGTADGQLKVAGTNYALTNAIDSGGLDTDVRPALTDKLEPGNKLQQWVADAKGRLHSMNNLNQCITNTSGLPINSVLASNDQLYRQNFIQNRIHVSACLESRYDNQRWMAGVKLPIDSPVREDKGQWTYLAFSSSYQNIPFANMTSIANNSAFYDNKDTNYYSTPTRVTQLLNIGASSSYYAWAPLASWQAWARENGYDVLAVPRIYSQVATEAKEVFVGLLSNINNDVQVITPVLDGFGLAVVKVIDAYNTVKNYFQNSFVRDLQCAFSWLPGVSCPSNAPQGYAAVIDQGGWDVYVFNRDIPVYNATLRTEEAPNKCLTNDSGRLNMQNCDSYNPAQQWSLIGGQFVNKLNPNIKTPSLFVDSQNGIHRRDDIRSCFGMGAASSNLNTTLGVTDILAVNPSQSAAIQSDLQKYNITNMLAPSSSNLVNLQGILAQLSTGSNYNYMNLNTYDFSDRQTCDVLGLWGRVSSDPNKDPPRPNMNDWGNRQRWIFRNTPASWSELQSKYYNNYMPSLQTELNTEVAKYAQLQANYKAQQASCDFAKTQAATGEFLPVCNSAAQLSILADQSSLNIKRLRNSANAVLKINEMVNDRTQYTQSPDRLLLCNAIKASSDSWFKSSQFIPEKYIKLYEQNYCDELFKVDSAANICTSMKNKYNLPSANAKPLEFPYSDLWDELKCKYNTSVFPVDCDLTVSPTVASCDQSPNGNYSPQKKVTVRMNPKNGGKTCSQVLVDKFGMKNPIFASTSNYNEFNVIERDGTYSSLNSCTASLSQ